jgi:hypothetical protein
MIDGTMITTATTTTATTMTMITSHLELAWDPSLGFTGHGMAAQGMAMVTMDHGPDRMPMVGPTIMTIAIMATQRCMAIV